MYVFVPQLQTFQKDVDKMYQKNVFNLETMREKLRSLNNRVQNCRTIPQDFRSKSTIHKALFSFIFIVILTIGIVSKQLYRNLDVDLGDLDDMRKKH